MDTDRFIVYIRTDDIYVDKRCWHKIWFFKLLAKSLPKGKNKKVIGLMKGELGWETIIKFAA